MAFTINLNFCYTCNNECNLHKLFSNSDPIKSNILSKNQFFLTRKESLGLRFNYKGIFERKLAPLFYYKAHDFKKSINNIQENFSNFLPILVYDGKSDINIEFNPEPIFIYNFDINYKTEINSKITYLTPYFKNFIRLNNLFKNDIDLNDIDINFRSDYFSNNKFFTQDIFFQPDDDQELECRLIYDYKTKKILYNSKNNKTYILLNFKNKTPENKVFGNFIKKFPNTNFKDFFFEYNNIILEVHGKNITQENIKEKIFNKNLMYNDQIFKILYIVNWDKPLYLDETTLYNNHKASEIFFKKFPTPISDNTQKIDILKLDELFSKHRELYLEINEKGQELFDFENNIDSTFETCLNTFKLPNQSEYDKYVTDISKIEINKNSTSGILYEKLKILNYISVYNESALFDIEEISLPALINMLDPNFLLIDLFINSIVRNSKRSNMFLKHLIIYNRKINDIFMKHFSNLYLL